jgi:hypothetical protein
MGSDFMPTFGYLFYKMGYFLGNPPQNKECRRISIKKAQKTVDVLFHPQLAL